MAEEDADVAAERERVCAAGADARAQQEQQRDSLRLVNLRKVYEGNPPKVAVEDLCLGVAAGERFGLLGPNGAGGILSVQHTSKRLKSVQEVARHPCDIHSLSSRKRSLSVHAVCIYNACFIISLPYSHARSMHCSFLCPGKYDYWHK